jgi:hypothetical protein
MGNHVNLCTRNGAVLREFLNGDGCFGLGDLLLVINHPAQNPLAFYLGINKTTVGRYRMKDKLYGGMYYFLVELRSTDLLTHSPYSPHIVVMF